MKLCWIVVLVGISIILVFLYSLVAMSSRSERFIEQLMEEEGRKGTDEQDMEAIITEGKERQEHELHVRCYRDCSWLVNDEINLSGICHRC